MNGQEQVKKLPTKSETKSTGTNKELKKSSLPTEEQDKPYWDSEQQSRWKIEGTPFETVLNKQTGEVFNVFGKYKLEGSYLRQRDAKQWADNLTWDKVLQVVQIMIEGNYEMAKATEKIDN